MNQAKRLDHFENKILCGNSIELLPTFPTDSIHLILSDIPYGIGVDDWDVLHKNTNSAYLGSSPAQKNAGAVFKKRGKPLDGWSDADKRIPIEYGVLRGPVIGFAY
jgi:site-specific DNA-methyltransferase (adenine-specific)